MFDPLAPSVVSVVAGFVTVLVYLYAQPTRVGPFADLLSTLRPPLYARVDALASLFGLYAARPVTREEYAGVLDCSPRQARSVLYENGFILNPVSALTYLAESGRPEDESWVYRDHPLATRQYHVVLFERADGRTDVFVHEEYSSLHPRTMFAHYCGFDKRIDPALRFVRSELPVRPASGDAVTVASLQRLRSSPVDLRPDRP